MKKETLRSKDAEELLKDYNITLSKKDIVERIDGKIIYLNKIPAFFLHEQRWVPTLKYLATNPILKQVVVDMGAIKFVVNGADIMRPGIVEIDETIQKDEPILIIDVAHKKPLAVGIALVDAKCMQETKTGKVVKNIHYVGDDIWKT